MISVSPYRSSFGSGPSIHQPRLDWTEVTLRCCEDIPVAISEVMSSMEEQPFSVTDGFAVQMGVTEILEDVFRRLGENTEATVRLHFQVTPDTVRVDLQVSQDVEAPRLNTVSLAKSFLTSVEFQDAGRRVLLTRGRGQGSAVKGPPLGYDFQI